jgi:hypothetical protein
VVSNFSIGRDFSEYVSETLRIIVNGDKFFRPIFSELNSIIDLLFSYLNFYV